MKTVNFATTNKEKLLIAQTVSEKAGISIKQVMLDIDEIQGEEAVHIIENKVKQAYEMFGKPIVVSDDSWDIPALGGFPGAYMKSINHWFTPDYFLRLMSGVKDRRIILHQYLAFTDAKTIKVFSNDVPGQVIHKPKGVNSRSPTMSVIAMDWDNGKTIAEVFELGYDSSNAAYKERHEVWHDFIDWYKAK